jgi:hypothetical protein
MRLVLLFWAIAQAPDYDAFSDRDGSIRTEQHGRGLISMLQRPGQLEAIYADAEKGNARAKRVFQVLETDYFPDTGREVAERVSRPPCLVPVVREMSGWCVPNWSFLDLLGKDQPGGIRLRKAFFAGFEERARLRGLENQLVLSVMNALLGATVAATAMREVQAAAIAPRTLSQILADAVPGKTSKPGMGSMQYTKTGGVAAANRDFDALASGQPVKTYSGDIRSCTLADGTTVSVRPSSSTGAPTIQVNPPSGNPVKIRYE